MSTKFGFKISHVIKKESKRKCHFCCIKCAVTNLIRYSIYDVLHNYVNTYYKLSNMCFTSDLRSLQDYRRVVYFNYISND